MRILLSHLSPTVCTGSLVLSVLCICMQNMTTRTPITTASGTSSLLGYLAYKRFYVKDHCSISMETFTTRKTAPVCTAVDGGQKFTLGNEFHTKHNKNRRQAGTWDPLLQGLHGTLLSSSNEIQRKLQGTKTNYVHVQFAQTMDKRYKQTKVSCHF